MPINVHLLLCHEFLPCGKARRSLRLITAEKMIMVLADTLFAEDNHANL